jgi:hypothetical protein
MFTIIIGTYGSLPYVHLQLESRRRFYSQVPCIVADDCSPQADALKTLAQAYGAEFYCNPNRLGHSRGDWSYFQRGLSVANTLYLLKLSRRFIPTCNIFDSIPHGPFITLGHQGYKYIENLRTDCVILSVKHWQGLPNLPRVPDVEFNITNHSRKFHQCPRVGYSCRQYFYTKWTELGYRTEGPSFALWHEADGPQAYYKLSQTYGLTYRIKDFDVDC